MADLDMMIIELVTELTGCYGAPAVSVDAAQPVRTSDGPALRRAWVWQQQGACRCELVIDTRPGRTVRVQARRAGHGAAWAECLHPHELTPGLLRRVAESAGLVAPLAAEAAMGLPEHWQRSAMLERAKGHVSGAAAYQRCAAQLRERLAGGTADSGTSAPWRGRGFAGLIRPETTVPS